MYKYGGKDDDSWLDVNQGGEAIANNDRLDMLRRVLATMAAAGLGAGAFRASMEVAPFFQRNTEKNKSPLLRRSVIEVPVRGARSQAAAAQAMISDNIVDKAAGDKDDKSSNKPWTDQLLEGVGRTIGIVRDPKVKPTFWQQRWAPTPTDGWSGQPWFWPAMAIGVPGAAIGGYRLADALIRRRRIAEAESAVERAKRDYESAMHDGTKQADGRDALDDAHDIMQKHANILDNISGPYLGGLGLTGILTAIAGYDHVRRNTDAKALTDALRRRQEALNAANPTVPVAIPVYDDDGDDDDRGGSGGRTRKQASLVRALLAARTNLDRRSEYYANLMANGNKSRQSRDAQRPSSAAAQSSPASLGTIVNR